MESISIAKISSKGQIVLPKSIREKFSKGDDVVFIKDGDDIILKKSSEIIEDLNNLKFQKNTFAQLEEYEKNKEKYNSMEPDDFIKMLKSKI